MRAAAVLLALTFPAVVLAGGEGKRPQRCQVVGIDFWLNDIFH